MAVSLEVKWDDNEVRRWRYSNMEGAMLRALSRAGVDAIRRTRAEANRYVRQQKAMKVKQASKGLVMVFPGSAKTWENMVWKLGFSGKPVPVIDYGTPRQTSAGVSVIINRGKRVVIKSAFIATMRSGHRGVFKRRDKKRLPIKELLTSRVSDVGADPGFLQGLADKAAVVFSGAFARLMALELDRKAA